MLCLYLPIKFYNNACPFNPGSHISAIDSAFIFPLIYLFSPSIYLRINERLTL